MHRLQGLIRSLAILYPLVLLFMRGRPYFHAVALGLGVIFIGEMLSRLPQHLLFIALGILALIGLGMAALGMDNSVRLYPFLMSASMLNIFIASKAPENNPMIGPFRQKFMADPEVLILLNEAKKIWIVGLALNTLILGVFLFAFSLDQWVLYAGFYSYLLLAALLVISIAYVETKKRSRRKSKAP